jgi:energy-coupling factor transporter ATP-binding protein EcfA2
MKDSSPFTPGSPVPKDFFVGREELISNILKYAKQVASGKSESVFLTGERGIGKSSLSSFLRTLLSQKLGFVSVHIFLGGVSNLEEVVRRIFDEIAKEAKSNNWFNKISNLFSSHVREVGLFGVSIAFDPPKDNLTNLVRNFDEALYNIISKIKETNSGLYVILDDINGLSKTPDFANWYKSLTDKIATQYKDFPVFFMLNGLPEIRDELNKQQPSLMRIFRILEIEKLSEEDVKTFFTKAFSSQNILIMPEALEPMVKHSSGLPILMQEIGDAVFWKNTDNEINLDDAIEGLYEAANRIGEKYLDPQVYRAIRSDKYKSILRKIGKKLSYDFKKGDIEKILDDSEKKVFHNFLRKMRDLGVIIQDLESERGVYKFVNNLYPLYIFLESLRANPKKDSS